MAEQEEEEEDENKRIRPRERARGQKTTKSLFEILSKRFLIASGNTITHKPINNSRLIACNFFHSIG
jgi:hypothetical protein